MTYQRTRLLQILSAALPFVVTAIFMSGAGRCALAQNVVQFLPGDAYFYAAFDEDHVNSLPKDGGTVTLFYDVYDEDFGSTAGFAYLRIEGVSPKLIEHLRSAYHDYRRDVPKVLKPHEYFFNVDGSPLMIEVNAPHVFVYNRDVDFSEQRIALKYNENWPHLPAEAFLPPERAKARIVLPGVWGRAEQYQPLVKTFDAVVEDWRNARRFRPLKVQVPKNVAWGIFGEPVKEPVVARADDIQFLVTTSGDLEGYFRRKPKLTFYQITKDRVKKCAWREREEDMELEAKVLAEEPEDRHHENKVKQ
jgi:hypothetical protein